MHLQFLPAKGFVILGRFNSLPDSTVSACNKANNQSFGYPIRRRDFRRIENPQPTAGPGTYIKQASAFQHPLYQGQHKFLNLWHSPLNSRQYFFVFFVNPEQQPPDRLIFQVIVQRTIFCNLSHFFLFSPDETSMIVLNHKHQCKWS